MKLFSLHFLPAVVLVLLVICSCGESNIKGGGDADGDSDGDSDGDTDGDTDGDADGDTDGDSDTPNNIPPSTNNGPDLDELFCEYTTIEEDETTFTGEIVVGNANTEYVWNGYYFTIWSIDFTTTSEITYAKTADWIDIAYSQEDDQLIFDMDWQSLFPLDTLVTFTVQGNKSGDYPYPSRCSPRYIRGDVIYPVYQNLPYTWWKNKEDLASADLIHDEVAYYEEDADPITETIFVYDPPHETQIQIGQPEVVPYTVNGYDDLRIWVPSKLMAMGVAFNYEWFKFNPNYFCALGTKENFACGLVPLATSPAFEHQVDLDGETYNWYINFGSPDGPFQQETGNFIDMARFFPDYFADDAPHDSYTSVSSDPLDDRWTSSVISSAISSVVSRESLWAAHLDDYRRIIQEADDPWAELAMITYTYNQGIFALGPTGVMDDIDATLASSDVAVEYGLDGVNNHVHQIRAMVEAMNGATDNLYDAEITWAEMEAFLSVVREFYPRGFPTSDEWSAMEDDVHAAFDLLAEHWGGDYISYRYDLLTLLRVLKRHLKTPTVPRPTTVFWRDRVAGLGW